MIVVVVFAVLQCLVSVDGFPSFWERGRRWNHYEERQDLEDDSDGQKDALLGQRHPLHRTALTLMRYVRRPSLSLENYLFPWLRSPTNVRSLVHGWGEERAIAISTGDHYFAHTVHLIRSIREIWNCDILIEVFYIGPQDLHPDHIRYLNGMPNVRCRDLYFVFREEHLHLRGWQGKPFAALACNARQVLLLDADAVLFKSPESFFKHAGFIRTGALFFYDRFILTTSRDWLNWFRQIIPVIRPHVLRNHMATQYSSHMMESGALVIDKGRNLHGLLMACILNSPPHVEELYHMTWGDKESYWIAFEMMA
jgi:hypothetical protein